MCLNQGKPDKLGALNLAQQAITNVEGKITGSLFWYCLFCKLL